MGQYRKKPVTIEAVRVADVLRTAQYAWDELPGWIKTAYDRGIIFFNDHHVLIQTTEGVMTGHYTAWILQGVKGELYPCSKEVFEDSYDSVESLLPLTPSTL